MTRTEEDLHDHGVALTLRLAMMADRLQRTAQELQELADSLRQNRGSESELESG